MSTGPQLPSKGRILFHYPILNIGGAELSSIRLMKALVDRGWSVDLVVTTGGGRAESLLDPRVRLHRLRPMAAGGRARAANNVIEAACSLPDAALYATMWTIGMIRGLRFRFRRYRAAGILLHGTPTWFVRKVVRAQVRMQWIRNDLARADPTGSTARAISSYAREIDHFVCVSNVTRDSLVDAVPTVKSKATVVYNVLGADNMRALALSGIDSIPRKDPSVVRVLTVCRLSEAPKGLLRMARVCQRLKLMGFRFEWYVVGDGADKDLLLSEIARLHIDDTMFLAGSMANPFPAYAAADIVAVLSNYEGLCGVVNEAKVMGKAVVATRFSGIKEQIRDGVSGLIVENEEEAILAGMARVLTDPELRRRLGAAPLASAVLDDIAKIEQLEALIDADARPGGHATEPTIGSLQ